MFKLFVLRVVMHEGNKMFLTDPASVAILGDGSVQTEKGILHYRVHVNRFSSYDIHGREVDTAVTVYRQGEIFSRGILTYIGGQSDGYLVSTGFEKPSSCSAKLIEVCNPHSFDANAFEEGDEVVLVCREK